MSVREVRAYVVMCDFPGCGAECENALVDWWYDEHSHEAFCDKHTRRTEDGHLVPVRTFTELVEHTRGRYTEEVGRRLEVMLRELLEKYPPTRRVVNYGGMTFVLGQEYSMREFPEGLYQLAEAAIDARHVEV